MKRYYFLTPKNELMFYLDIDLPEPIQVVFCKDRKTNQRYVMFRTITDNALTAPQKTFPVPFSQYDGVKVATK